MARKHSMKTKHYDLVVIGTGDAGKSVALTAAKEKWKVAIVEKRAIGGTCALRGCVPKKVLISGEELADFNRRLGEAGLSTGLKTVSWPELMAFKDRFTGSFSRDDETNLEKYGIDIYRDTARFVAEAAIEAEEAHLQGNYLHIATGARPRPLDIPGAEYLTTSDDFLYLEQLPQRIIFAGGGYVSFELAHLAARCGSKVTIMNRSARVLKKFDPDMTMLLVKASQDIGINIAVNEPLLKVEKSGAELKLFTETNGREKVHHADMVVHGAGRVPDIEDLNLDAAGIEYGPEGVAVNEYLQSVSNPKIYAAGDAAAGGPPLTPIAMLEGKIAAENIVHGLKKPRPDYRIVPSVVFTLPKLAAVGLSEEDAAKQGLQYAVKSKETSDWLHNKRVNEVFGGFKIILDKQSQKILGAHIFDSHADDLINMFALAMQHNLNADDITSILYAYPSASSSIQYMLE